MLDAQIMFVCVIKEQKCTQKGNIEETKSSCEMNVTINSDFCIRDVGAVDKDYLIQVFHLRLQFESY